MYKASDIIIHTYQKCNKLLFNNSIFCVFFKGSVAASTFAPVNWLVIGTSLVTIAYPAAAVITVVACIKLFEKKHKIELGKLEDFNKAINESQMTLAVVQEQVQTQGNMRSNIFENTNETKIFGNYLGAHFYPTFDNLKHAATKLQELCTDYLSINLELKKF